MYISLVYIFWGSIPTFGKNNFMVFIADHVSPGCDTLLHLEIHPFFYLPVVSHVTGNVD